MLPEPKFRLGPCWVDWVGDQRNLGEVEGEKDNERVAGVGVGAGDAAGVGAGDTAAAEVGMLDWLILILKRAGLLAAFRLQHDPLHLPPH